MLSDKARILILAGQYFPPFVGGSENFTFELARHLHLAGQTITVVTTRQPGDAQFDAQQPFQVLRLFSLSSAPMASAVAKARQKLDMFWSIFRAIRATRPDLILVASWDPYAYIAWVATWGRPVPLFIVVYGTELVTFPAQPLFRALKNRLRLWTFAASRQVFPISAYTRQITVNLGTAASKLTVITPGVDESFVELSKTPRVQREVGSAPRLISVCRLVQRKGVDTTLRALPALIETYPDLEYAIVGDGAERAALEQLANELGVADHVRFCGRVSDDEKNRLYDQADLFVLPSRLNKTEFEGFGIVFLEALAHGVAVVGANTGGIPDAVENGVTGLLVPQDDPVALAAAADRLLAQPALRQQFVAAAAERIQGRYRWASIAGQFMHEMRKYL